MVKTEQTVNLMMDIIPRLMQSFATTIRSNEIGLSPAHFRILHMLHHRQMSMSDLAELQSITKASLCDSVNLLVDRGWVEKSKDDSDQRRINLTLTEEGQEQINRVHSLMHDHLVHRLATANDADLELIANGLIKIRDLLLAKESRRTF